MKKLIYLIILILLLPSVFSLSTNTHSITLLSVSELENGSYKGNTAKLYLTLKPGTGSVYIDSFPLAQIDTQLSTKLANDVACSISTMDCSKYDFFYKIDVGSSIVSGPSAGGAITLLTLSILENNPVNESIAMTGMISSGGIITPVDGIYEKVKAASEDDEIKLVFIPDIALDNPFGNFSENKTILTMENLSKYNVTIEAVTNVWEAYNIITKQETKKDYIVNVPEFYLETMNQTQHKLCTKSNDLISSFPPETNDSLFKYAKEYINKSTQSYLAGDFYSAASFCYSANLRLRELQMQNMSQELLYQNYMNLIRSLDEFDNKMDAYELVTFTDLETYMIVRERTIDARDELSKLNLSNISHQNLAYAVERLNSALAWSSFLGKEGQQLNVNQETLRKACFNQLRKANMMSSYLSLFLDPLYLEDLNLNLKHAEKFYNEEKYPMCLYVASNARAEAEYILTSIPLDDEFKTKKLVDAKINSMQKLISEQENAFPIMGYSYLEYSSSLIDDEPISALLFSEYGIIFSDLTAYFPSQQEKTIDIPIIDFLMIFSMFLAGFVFGIIFAKLFLKKRK